MNEKYTFEDFLALYKEYEEKHKDEVYKYLSTILDRAKRDHWAKFEKRKDVKDHGQAWRSAKGRYLEKLIRHIIEERMGTLGLAVEDGRKLERRKEKSLSTDLSKLKRNLLISYEHFGYHFPDVDILIYEPKSLHIVAVLSSKVTLRERVAQAAYWKLKMASQALTKHIKVYFLTPDEDGDLKEKKPPKKGRAIVEKDIDCTYIMSEKPFETSDKVKSFGEFFTDMEALLRAKP